MPNFPEIMIVRYYESWIIDVSYSDDWSEENRKIIDDRLEKELDEDKYLETYKIYYNWKENWNNIKSEEEREKNWNQFNKKNKFNL